MVYTLSLFHKSNIFGSCIIHILYTGVLKLKKQFWRQKVNQKGVNLAELLHCVYLLYSCTTGFSMGRVMYALSSPKVYEKF